MYSYHLWIVLAESTQENDIGGLQDKINGLRTLLAESLDTRPEHPIIKVNCDWLFQCSVSHNHKGDAQERLESVLRWITRRLPGSYGLVYYRDDEDPREANSYRVLVVSRGGVVERTDPFLSPVVPTIED
ncbi:MAG TPA: Imm7 family immunity protein [Polyangiaceae bacterium]|nr:Imm7 family immunity protein [Polyangiaceae bacterium]